MKATIMIAILILTIFLTSCTDKEWIQIICEKPEGFQTQVLCWFLSSADEPASECFQDSDCKGACSQEINVMEGRCKKNKCTTQYSYSCQENGIDARCYMEAGKPKCTTPANQCAFDDDCEPACKDDDVMTGYCNEGRCALKYVKTCPTQQSCFVSAGSAACA